MTEKEMKAEIKDLEWQLQEVAKDNDYYQAENKKLEEENAELDMKRKAERKIFQGIVEKKNNQLTKARELINLFIQWNYGCSDIPDYKDLVKQAEQFLKEGE